MTPRRKWRGHFEEIRYCGQRCRRNRPGALDAALEQRILELLAQRRHGATICPSEATRSLRPEDWRDQLERIRNAARRLAAEGRIEIVQGGRPVEPSTARGPIRLRLCR